MSYFLQQKPFVVPTPGSKLVEEHFGLASTGDRHISIVHMVAPPGLEEASPNPSP